MVPGSRGCVLSLRWGCCAVLPYLSGSWSGIKSSQASPPHSRITHPHPGQSLTWAVIAHPLTLGLSGWPALTSRVSEQSMALSARVGGPSWALVKRHEKNMSQ